MEKKKAETPLDGVGGEQPEEAATKENGFFACYLLVSSSPRHKGHTYIAFTVNPRQRIRQHNGEIRCGAWRTKRGRPWEMVLCIYGFPTNVGARKIFLALSFSKIIGNKNYEDIDSYNQQCWRMWEFFLTYQDLCICSKHLVQFEWAWQHPLESLAVRKAAATFKSLSGLENKIKLAFTMLTLPAWESLNLTVNFFSTKYIKYKAACPGMPKDTKVAVRAMDELPCYLEGADSRRRRRMPGAAGGSVVASVREKPPLLFSGRRADRSADSNQLQGAAAAISFCRMLRRS